MSRKSVLVVFLCCLLVVPLVVGKGSRPDFPPAAEWSKFEAEWKRVDELGNKGLSESALKVVNEIYDKALAEGNEPQIVKASVHRLKYTDYVTENAFIEAVAQMKEQAKTFEFPLRNVFHSLLAEMNWWYYENNRWRFIDRSETVGHDNDDMETWSLERLVNEVNGHYEHSLKDAAQLRSIPAATYDDVITEGRGGRELQPSLYDFLAHRALRYYESSEPGLTRPAYQFKVKDSTYFAAPPTFTNLDIDSQDTLSNEWRYLRIHQQLEDIHGKEGQNLVLAHLELKRLRWVKDHASMEGHARHYREALMRMREQHVGSEIQAEINFALAEEMVERGRKYQPLKSDQYRWLLRDALALCESTIEANAQAYGAKRCKVLKAGILEKSLLTQGEAQVPAGMGSKILLNYRNLDHLFLRIVSVEEQYLRPIEGRYISDSEWLDILKSATAEREWEVDLPASEDHQEHSVELPVPQMPFGHYALLVSDNKSFHTTGHAVAVQEFTVTNMAYVQRYDHNGEVAYFLVDRQVGAPISGVSAQLYSSTYNYQSRSNEVKKGGVYTSDAQGKIILKSPDNNLRYWLEFSYKGDRLFTGQEYQYVHRDYEPKWITRSYIFTDRAIYRPGQTVHFKGIVLEQKDEDARVKAGTTIEVKLYDVNGQEASSLNLKTNDYGTYQGTFVLPATGLTGTMRIRDNHGQQYIKVEEYRRPKFEVEMLPIIGNYRLGSEVVARGAAKSYAGAPLGGAEVSYRVVRETHYPYWAYRYYGWFLPTGSSIEVANGATQADEKGEFEIPFVAIADGTADRQYEPWFQYSVYADVTDINGETHSGRQTISVGAKAMVLKVNIAASVDRKAKAQFPITATNLMGEPTDAEVDIEIHKLITPERVYRDRLWQRPDQYLMDQEEYHKKFPHDPYADEDQIQNWKVGNKVWQAKLNTAEQRMLEIDDLASWELGAYRVTSRSTDPFGEEVSETRYFSLYGEGKRLGSHPLDWFVPVKASGEPGEKAVFLVGSGAENVHMLYQVEHGLSLSERKWIKINKSQTRIEVPIEEAHRGNFSVNFMMVKYGRVFQHNQLVSVPFTNKQLDITFETFRDQLLPGTKETWKIRVKGPKGDPAAAEMMATLYDASLDAFTPHFWNFNLYQRHSLINPWSSGDCFNAKSGRLLYYNWNKGVEFEPRTFDRFNWFGYSYYAGAPLFRMASPAMALMEIDEEIVADSFATEGEFKKREDGIAIEEKPSAEEPPVQVRTNFNETAFFYPQLETNAEGEVSISFTIPEALTRWKMLGLAHTKSLEYGLVENELVTRKEVMVTPNFPRYFREGDTLWVSAKIDNLTDSALKGQGRLELFDPFTNELIPGVLIDEATQLFEVGAQANAVARWKIQIPSGLQVAGYRVIARAGQHSDGEEHVLPVLTNRMLVTETLPLPVRKKGNKSFEFEHLKRAGSSKTLRHHRLTLEFTSNPAWYAVQALTYLDDYPYDCAEQTFSKFYANSIAEHLVNSSPKIKTVFENWQQQTPDALLSNLEKNQDLKNLVLEETPWVMQAKDETERKRRMALLFDVNKMSNSLAQSVQKIQELQVSNGGWPWFKGMRDNRFITQHIITGMGHLDHLGVNRVRDGEVWDMVQKGVKYLDDRILEDWLWLKKHTKDMKADHLGPLQIHYLYARTYFTDLPLDGDHEKAYKYYLGQAKKYGLKKSRYFQGMAALALNRTGNKEAAQAIMASLKENAIYHDEMGMYWKHLRGYYWYEAPIERQALLIEAFDEVMQDTESVELMKVWLLKQKQTQDWKTTKATTEACYALLLRGTDWLANEETVSITLGDQSVRSDDPALGAEKGTGYFRTSWEAREIDENMGDISVDKATDGVAWGAMYWQYFEQLDRIEAHDSPLSIDKKVFVEETTDRGPVIRPVTDKTLLNVGDRLKIRIEIRVDRDMEYVHLKDLRAAALEPIETLSGYRYQDGLGYYQSGRDASMNFFFGYLTKGTYVFEYPLRVNTAGDYSNGITTMQCMYAPEFSTHSEGVRLKIQQ